MSLRHGSEELLPVYRRCVFRSDTRVDSHFHVARELADHNLHWKRGAVDVAMFKGSLQRLQLFVLRYGAEVEVTPGPFEDFALVHMSLKGAAEIESDGHKLEIGEGRAAVGPPRHHDAHCVGVGPVHVGIERGDRAVRRDSERAASRDHGVWSSAAEVLAPQEA